MNADTLSEQPVGYHSLATWDEVKRRWCNGESAGTISVETGIPENTIRVKAFRHKWPKIKADVVKTVASRATERAIREEIAKAGPTIKAAAKAEIERCLETTKLLGETLAKQALRRAETCEDGHASSIASLAKAGTGIWREAVGLSNSGDGSNPQALNIHVVLRGGPHEMLPVGPEAQKAIDV